MIYTPVKPTNKPEISFGAEIRTPRESDNEDQEDEVTEVESDDLSGQSTMYKTPTLKSTLTLK